MRTLFLLGSFFHTSWGDAFLHSGSLRSPPLSLESSPLVQDYIECFNLFCRCQTMQCTLLVLSRVTLVRHVLQVLQTLSLGCTKYLHSAYIVFGLSVISSPAPELTPLLVSLASLNEDLYLRIASVRYESGFNTSEKLAMMPLLQG